MEMSFVTGCFSLHVLWENLRVLWESNLYGRGYPCLSVHFVSEESDGITSLLGDLI